MPVHGCRVPGIPCCSAALAEALWTPTAGKNFQDFAHRLELMAQLWNRYTPAVNYHYLTPRLFAHWTPDVLRKGMEYSIDNPSDLKALAAGSCGVIFDYTGGGQALSIKKVELLSGGQVIATDEHDGFTGNSKQRNIYTLHFPPAAYSSASLRVTGDAGGSADSNGDITLITGKVLDQYNPKNYPLGTVALGYWQPSDLSLFRHGQAGSGGPGRRHYRGGGSIPIGTAQLRR